MKQAILILFFIGALQSLKAQTYDIVVAADGSGQCRTLTEATALLPMFNYQRITIFVKNGVYNEKIRLEQDYITIVGESRDSTIIEFSQLREDWQKQPDAIGPAVINIHADDIVLNNLTIRNTQPQLGPHAFTVYGTGTRTIITNCTVTSNGGDTVSLWDYKTGMYYYSHCYFEGCVDFVCPRGWCYMSHSTLHQLKETATLWHAGPVAESQKFVIKGCQFTGVDGYNLGRHHYEAQFILIDCQFSANMADQPIYYHHYPDEPQRNRPYFWKDRYYFHNCTKAGKQFGWHANNFASKGLMMYPDSITPKWTFDGLWDPEQTELPKVVKTWMQDGMLYVQFSEPVGTSLDLALSTTKGDPWSFLSGQGRDTLMFSNTKTVDNELSLSTLKVSSGRLFGIVATVNERVYTEGMVLNFEKSPK